MRKQSVYASVGMVVISGLLATAEAAPITAGNPVVMRVLPATSPNRGAAVFLDEYNATTGAVVQTITVPSTGSGALVLDTSITEGVLTPTADGTKILFAGYRKDANTTGAPTLSTASGGSPRVIGSLNLGTGVADTSFSTSGTWALGNIRSVASVSGASLYVSTSASNQGVVYLSGSGAAPVQIASPNRNTRSVVLANIGGTANTLVGSDGSAGDRVYTYGSLPTTATTATSLGITGLNVENNAVQGMVFLDLDPTIAGDDTLYLVQQGQPTLGGGSNRGLQKWVIDSTTSTWISKGFLATSTDVAAFNLSGYYDGSQVNLFVTGTTQLYKVSDATGLSGSLSGNLADYTLATVPSGFAFRGVAVVPEPATLALFGLAVGPLVMRRRRR